MRDGRLRLWQAQDGSPLAQWGTPTNGKSATQVWFSDDGSTLCATDHGVDLSAIEQSLQAQPTAASGASGLPPFVAALAAGSVNDGRNANADADGGGGGRQPTPDFVAAAQKKVAELKGAIAAAVESAKAKMLRSVPLGPFPESKSSSAATAEEASAASQTENMPATPYRCTPRPWSCGWPYMGTNGTHWCGFATVPWATPTSTCRTASTPGRTCHQVPGAGAEGRPAQPAGHGPGPPQAGQHFSFPVAEWRGQCPGRAAFFPSGGSF
eukprot:m.135294 g.135294  ORF g.135294 m.135294 type:complete len:268 (+) comp20157_c5_seq4:815-1618(+)